MQTCHVKQNAKTIHAIQKALLAPFPKSSGRLQKKINKNKKKINKNFKKINKQINYNKN